MDESIQILVSDIEGRHMVLPHHPALLALGSEPRQQPKRLDATWELTAHLYMYVRAQATRRLRVTYVTAM